MTLVAAARPGRRSRCGRSRSGPRSRRSPRPAARPRPPGAARPRRGSRRPGRGPPRGARAGRASRRRTRRRGPPGRRRPSRANLIPSAEPWHEGLTTIGKPSRSSIARQRVGGAELAEGGLAEREELGRRDARPRPAGASRAPCPSRACRRARRSRCRGCRGSRAAPARSRPRRRGRAARRTPRRARASRSRSMRSRPTSIATDVVAEPGERVLDPRARAQRHLALERAAALEHRDAAHRPPAPAGARSRRRGSARRAGSAPGSARPWLAPRGSPVSVPYRATCSSTTSPMRRMPSRIVVLVGAGEVQPHRERPRPSRKAASPGHERDVVAQRAGQQVGGVDEVGQRGPDEQPAAGRVHSACGGKWSASASSIVSRRAR